MKHCNKCNLDLPDSAFGKNGNGTKSICKKCASLRVREGQILTKQYIQTLKTQCAKCGYNKNRYALEFHHTNPLEKDGAITQYGKRIFSPAVKELIDNEVKKCIVLCANCHREEHHPEV